MNNSWKVPRIAAAAALVACMLAAFAALGGVGVAQSAVNAAQGQYGKKVTICHKGKTITVSKKALPAHLRHHDTIGTCAAAKAKKAKAAKIKAAKAKAEKAKAEKTKTQEDQKPSKGENPGKGKGKGK